MLPLTNFPARTAGRVKVVFTDIDDTLTIDGRLTRDAFTAMWNLHDAGIAVVPVTGRPAGWCDHIARMWPVAGVVGENGAFFFAYDTDARKMAARYVLDAAAREKMARRLGRLGKKILREVPAAAISPDQDYRLFDLAIDYCEDIEPLPTADVDRIVALFEQAGATAKVSSIHVNGWFGDWDKVTMIRRFANEILDLDLDRRAHNARAVYVGDSPNDEPAFEFFSGSIGVANIREFSDRLEHPPTYVTRGRGGAGFAQVARKLIRSEKFRRK